jgi:geranylgeranyl diphosphate synthase type II
MPSRVKAQMVERDFTSLEALLEERRALVDAALVELTPPGEAPVVDAAIAYSLHAPAKRVRPILALMVADLLRAEARAVLPAACAVEMVHTSSLILDDLPAMDDARLRRGRAACHVVHGEAAAILAAFALLNRGFEVLVNGWPGAPDPAVRESMAVELGRAVGGSGMIAGQAADLGLGDRPLDFATLEFIHSRKTGALFMAAAALGARAGRASAAESATIAAYAKNLGLAFQIKDDLIDVTGTTEEAGKDVRQDLKKTTFVSFSGVEGARTLAGELIAASREALTAFGARADALRELADYVLARKR